MFLHIAYEKCNPLAIQPSKKHQLDACYDLYTINADVIPAQGHTFFPLGLKMEIPDGFVGIIKGRSGLTKQGIIVPTGTIDCNYRGELGVTVYNLNEYPFEVESGYRIAQFTVQEMCFIGFKEVDHLLTTTDRGEDGFGSTGVK